MNSLVVTFLAATILLILIFNIKTSRRFNLFDHWLHHKLVKQRDGFKWQVIAFLNDPKLMVVWAVLLASALIDQNRIMTALWVLGTLGFTDIVGVLLKKSIKRKRPIMSSELESGYSFPSGHVLGTTTMVLILIQLFSKQFGVIFTIALICIWVMVIISRLSLKAHYPSDVIGAASLSVFCFSICQQIFLAI